MEETVTVAVPRACAGTIIAREIVTLAVRDFANGLMLWARAIAFCISYERSASY